jgi:hypothetical protein
MGPEDERDSEEDIQPGDLVIKLVDGEPYIQTRPDLTDTSEVDNDEQPVH